MSLATNTKRHQRPSNSQAPILHKDWIDVQAVLSVASSSASASQSPWVPNQISNHVQTLAPPSVVPEISLLSPEGGINDVEYRDNSAIAHFPSRGYAALDVQLENILESGEDDGNEEDETSDQLTSLVQATSTINVDRDREIVSDFMRDDVWDSGPSDKSSRATTTPSIPADQGMPLRRVNTSGSIRSRISVFGLAPLSRTLSSVSSWSNRLDRVRYWGYTLEEWGQKIRDSASLCTAEIVKVDRYVQKTMIPHRFLVFQLRRAKKSRDIFLRLDRRPVPGIGFILRLGVTPANDCALLAADEKRAARGNTPTNVEIVREASLTFLNAHTQPKLHHLERILNAMSLKMMEYQLTKENCWFFCAVCLLSLSSRFVGDFSVGTLNHVGLPAASKLQAYAEILVPSLLHTISTPSDVVAIAVSPDGNHIVSGHWDPFVRLWDARTGLAIGKPLEGHINWVRSVAFSPNGRWIVSGSEDSSIRLWDVETCTPIGKPLRGHGGWILSVAFSPDGEKIVSGSWDHTVRLWDRATGSVIGEPLKGHTSDVNSVAFSPDGRLIASGSNDKTIRLWDALTGNAIGDPLVGHTSVIMSVTFSPNGQHISSAAINNTVRIWSIATHDQICKPLKGHTSYVCSVAFSPDGRYIASGSDDKTIQFWDAMTGAAINVPPIRLGHYVTWISFFPDGQRIASCGGGWIGSGNKTILIWDVPF